MIGWIVYALVGMACAGNSIKTGKEHGFSGKASNGIALAVMAAFVVLGVWFHYS